MHPVNDFNMCAYQLVAWEHLECYVTNQVP